MNKYHDHLQSLIYFNNWRFIWKIFDALDIVAAGPPKKVSAGEEDFKIPKKCIISLYEYTYIHIDDWRSSQNFDF